MKNKKLIIDFDSTFVSSEGLEELGEIALRDLRDRAAVTFEIARITSEGMDGKISFTDSLRSRINLLQANKKHVERLSKALLGQVTPSFLRNQGWVRKNQKDIYIVSGGFHDFIDKTLLASGILPDHIFANRFVYDDKENVVGFDEENFLSQAEGKVKLLRSLELEGEVIVIGGGWTDYEMKEAGVASRFFAFTENVKRDRATEVADQVVDSFDKVVEFV